MKTSPLWLVAPLMLSAPAPAQPPELDPAKGQEVGLILEAFLSPWQEPDEESNTPKGTPETFLSTAPSMTRAEREAAGHRGHGQVRFSKDLSRAWVDVEIEGIRIEDINMFHIHCGRPDVLGPILVDFSQATNIQDNFKDGVFSVEVTDALIAMETAHNHGAVATFTSGCTVPSASLKSAKPTKVATVAGMAQIGLEGELYFNLHTKGQTFFGDIRGQLHPLPPMPPPRPPPMVAPAPPTDP